MTTTWKLDLASHKKNPKYTGFGWIIYAIGHRTIFYEKVRKRNAIKFFKDFVFEEIKILEFFENFSSAIEIG